MLDWLKTAGHTEASKIIDREDWSKKRRGEFANKVVDGMEGNGEIKALYRDFKTNLEAARDAKVRSITPGIFFASAKHLSSPVDTEIVTMTEGKDLIVWYRTPSTIAYGASFHIIDYRGTCALENSLRYGIILVSLLGLAIRSIGYTLFVPCGQGSKSKGRSN